MGSASADPSTCCSTPRSGASLGFVVLCGDESLRFLVFAAADVQEDAIAVPSALLLLEDMDFYRARSRSLRDLLGGELRDLVLAPDGSVETLLVEEDDAVREARPVRTAVESRQVSPARG